MLSTAKYSEACRFIRDKILMGATDSQILEEFRILHESILDVYSTHGGGTLSPLVLKNFRVGVEADNRRREKMRVFMQESSARATDWFTTSPAVALVKQRLMEGCPYKQVLKELDILHKEHPDVYSTRTGQPITTATLSLWSKRLGFQNRNKNKEKVQSWRDNSIGYQWFKCQVLADVPQGQIITEFNALHESDPGNYSTPMGAAMTISTYNRWCREILAKETTSPQRHVEDDIVTTNRRFALGMSGDNEEVNVSKYESKNGE